MKEILNNVVSLEQEFNKKMEEQKENIKLFILEKLKEKFPNKKIELNFYVKTYNNDVRLIISDFEPEEVEISDELEKICKEYDIRAEWWLFI